LAPLSESASKLAHSPAEQRGSKLPELEEGQRRQGGARQSGSELPHSIALHMSDWPHSPVHRVREAGTYMVTAGTYLKRPFFRGAERLRYLCEMLLELADKYEWQLQAWAVFPNHYHFVAVSPETISGKRQQAGGVPERQQAAALHNGALKRFIKHLHSVTAIQVNRWDRTVGRQAWFQYWDTQLTFQKAYLARLSYVHRNAVHHGLVREPSLYPWCSAGWLQRRATTAFYKTVMGMKIDRVQVADEFSVDVSEI
jgi:putative transposase